MKPVVGMGEGTTAKVALGVEVGIGLVLVNVEGAPTVGDPAAAPPPQPANARTDISAARRRQVPLKAGPRRAPAERTPRAAILRSIRDRSVIRTPCCGR